MYAGPHPQVLGVLEQHALIGYVRCVIESRDPVQP
jgi:hypothetical protein